MYSQIILNNFMLILVMLKSTICVFRSNMTCETLLCCISYTETEIKLDCGEPAISFHSHHVSLVQWTNSLLPVTRDLGQIPWGVLMLNRDSPVSVVSLAVSLPASQPTESAAGGEPCGEPAISLNSHHVSLVQWTTCLLPVTRDPGSNPLAGT
jgi:hypothetical protein